MSESDTPRTDDLDDKLVDLSPNSETDYSLMKSHARKLERELTAARAEIDRYKLASEHLNQMVNAVTEQRDRLAEALRKAKPFIYERIGYRFDEEMERDEIIRESTEALQSLTTKNNTQPADSIEAKQGGGGDCVSRLVRPYWSRKVTHKNLGECIINMECLAMQLRNADPTSIFVEHDGDIKEVSRSMISETNAASETRRE